MRAWRRRVGFIYPGESVTFYLFHERKRSVHMMLETWMNMDEHVEYIANQAH